MLQTSFDSGLLLLGLIVLIEGKNLARRAWYTRS